MPGKISEKSGSLPVFALLASILLLGCEEEPSQKPAADTNTPQSTQDIVVEKDNTEKPVTAENVSLEDLQTGEYSLQVSYGEISLVSAWTSRITILEDMAGKIGFELYYSLASDDEVWLNQPSGSTAEILQSLLAGVEYRVEYNAHVDGNGFRIARLYLDSLAGKRISSAGESETWAREDPAVAIPPADAQIFLGDDPESIDLATRLEFGTVEDQVDAVAELGMDPAGLNAAYQVYSRSHSPEVRTAVLERVETEDNYLARAMIARSLQSTDAVEASYALSIVDSLDDYSLAPQVEALTGHYDAGVRALAMEVLESITADYATDDEPAVNFNPPDSSRNRKDRGEVR